jgi:hypothetical protein
MRFTEYSYKHFFEHFLNGFYMAHGLSGFLTYPSLNPNTKEEDVLL